MLDTLKTALGLKQRSDNQNERREKSAYWPSDEAAKFRDLSRVCLEPDGKIYEVHDDGDGYHVVEDDGIRTYLIWG